MPLSIPQAVAPSTQAGYARGPSESAYPGLWRGLSHAHVPFMGGGSRNCRDFAGRYPSTVASNAIDSTVNGRSVYMSAAVGDSYDLVANESDRGNVFSGNGDTVLCWYQKADNTLRQGMAYGVNAGSATEWCGAQFPWNDGDVYCYYGGSAGNNFLQVGGLNAVDGPNIWIQRGGPSGLYLWQNGNLVGSKTVAITKSIGTSAWKMGNFAGFGNDIAYVYACIVWKRELNAQEIAQLSRDPLAPWRLQQGPFDAVVLPISVSESSSLALTESQSNAQLISDASTLTLTESDSVSLTAAKFDPLVIISGQVQELPTGALLETPPRTLNLTNAQGSTINRCQVVRVSADNTVVLAQASSLANSAGIAGFVYDEEIANTSAGAILVDGVMEATTAEWDAVTGGSGGLTAGSEYYLDPATAGHLTTTATTTSGQVQAPLGTAVSTTKLIYTRGERVLM